MDGLRKQLPIVGSVVLIVSTAVFGYACYGESKIRPWFNEFGGADFGFLPFDLLQGRTHFERRSSGEVVASLYTGPLAEGRIAVARATFGAGLFGAVLILFSLFAKRKSRETIAS